MSSITLDRELEEFTSLSFPDRDSIGSALEYFGLCLTTPIHWSSEYLTRVMVYPTEPGKYGNMDTRIAEVARRVFTWIFHVAIAPITLTGYILGGAIQALGEMISTKSYYHIEGEKQPFDPNNFSLMTFNACAYWGGLPDHGGGLRPASQRLEGHEKLIREQNPDFLSLQEMSFGPGLALADRIRDQYAHLYTNIGAPDYRTTFYTAGPELFFASKAPIVSEPQFIPYNLHSDKIGFFCIETPTLWILSAHFPDGKEEKWPHRRALLLQIRSKMDELKRETGKEAVLMGDLNVRRTSSSNDEYSQSGINKLFYDPCTEQLPDVDETCTNAFLSFRLKPEDPLKEVDDYLLFSPKAKDNFNITVTLGKDAYNIEKPQEALSDHRYYTARVTSRQKT